MKKTTFAALACALLLSGCGERGTGEKNGVITKFAKTGFFCKTWEAEIVRGGFNSGTGVQGAAFDVTVEDEKLVPLVQKALETQSEVRIHYRTELATFCRSDSNDTFLTSIEIVRQGQGGVVNDTGKPATAAAPGAAITAAQLQQLLDNQSRSIEQNERLVKVVETLAARK